MTEPDWLPLAPGLRLEYEVRRSGETLRLVVEQRAADGGAVTVRRTWSGGSGPAETEESRLERRPDGVYADGGLVLPSPARVGAEWPAPPRRYRVEARDAAASVPAGEFTACLRVGYLIAEGDGGSGERVYAPGVGLVRELCSDEADPYEVTLTRGPSGGVR